MNDFFKNKKILITGGTGSFGNAVVRKFLATNIEEIHIYSRDEKKQDDMRNQLRSDKLKFIIGDVRCFSSLKNALTDIDFVFHAAALKQVPSCEFYPVEAIKTNILGTENVINASIESGVDKAIFLSTDKAVYPINAMGISKAMAEKIMVSKSRGSYGVKTTLCATRYGNVLGSRGSVVPLFVDQAKNGQALTITDPNMTRFMMTLDESVDLVMHALYNANRGDIFIQKAPACTIQILAESILELYNSSAGIRNIGTRHGEKLYETLVSREEMYRAKLFKNFYQIPVDDRDLNYSKYFNDGEDISSVDDYNSHNTTLLNKSQVKRILLKLDFIERDFRA